MDKNKMKILAIGDVHGSEKIKKISLRKADLILLPGDIGSADLARKLFLILWKVKKVVLET